MAELDNLSLEGFDLGAALGISPEAEAAKKTPPPGARRHQGIPQDGSKTALAQGGIRKSP